VSATTAGFEEAPWPAGSPAPVDYPSLPGHLGVGDWVWMSPASVTSILDELDVLVDQEQILALLIYDWRVGSGSA
jgi:hypothetical protein